MNGQITHAIVDEVASFPEPAYVEQARRALTAPPRGGDLDGQWIAGTEYRDAAVDLLDATLGRDRAEAAVDAWLVQHLAEIRRDADAARLRWLFGPAL